MPFLRIRTGRVLQGLGRRLVAAGESPGPLLPFWAHELERAIAQGELSLVYQPKLNVRTEQITQVEALVRWEHPKVGAISPADFIPVAERGGIIRDVTEWVLQRAIADQARMCAAGVPLAVSVNLSGRLVSDENFTVWALERCAGAVGPLTLEITETAVIGDPERALENLRAYAAANITIAIDDYGAGLSSLAYLKQLPARELKIDRMFVEGLAGNHRDPLLVRSTIDLAHALDMEVTAEGVESSMALALLRVMGCDHVQGFHIARPMSLEDLCRFIRRFDGVAVDRPIPWATNAALG